MGATPRTRITQLPMPTRSTEASTDCFGRIVLSYLREDEQADASYFVLGDLLHRGIEYAVTADADLAYMATTWIFDALANEPALDTDRPYPRIESSKRGFDTIHDDYQRMMANWYDKVHPDSDKRHPIYDDYQWPPQVELQFHRTARSAGTAYPVWGSVDTLFERKGDDGYLIVDWKSGTQRQRSDFQLNFYKFGMNLPEAVAAFHHLDRVQDRAIIQLAEDYPGDDQIRQAILLTERRKEAVAAGYMPRFQPSPLCNYCPVQHLCPVEADYRIREQRRDELEDLLRSVEVLTEIPAAKGETI